MPSLLDSDGPSQPGPSVLPSLSTPTTPPIASWQKRRLILDVPTEILVQVYDDRILVIITQNDKLGSLVQASIPPMYPLPHPQKLSSTDIQLVLPPPPESIALLPLLGSPPNPNLHSIYVSQIATLVWWALQEVQVERRSVVVGLTLARTETDVEEDGMDDSERERFMSIMSLLAEWPGPEQ